MNTTATATETTYRWDEPRPMVGRCPRCKAAVAAMLTLDQAGAASWQVRSDCCGRWSIVAQVAGKTGTRECGAWCEDGTGKACTCTCGGRNHGMTWRIRP
jgi:hypothetical protein